MPYLILGGAQIAVGAAAIFARYALAGAGPLAVSAGRLCIAAVVLLAYAALRRQSGTPPDRRQSVLLAFAGVALAAHFATWIWSLQYVPVAISVLLGTSTPIWTAAYDALVLGRRLSRLALGAFAGGGIGLFLVVGFDRAPPPIGGHELLGALLALVGGITMGAYLLLVRAARGGLNTRTIVTRTYTWSAAALVVAALVARQPPPALHDASAWAGIAAMGFISQLLGHTAINASLRWFSPSAVSFAILLEPVIAAILAFALFQEAVAPLALAGGVLLLAAIAVVLREERMGPNGQLDPSGGKGWSQAGEWSAPL